MAGAVAAEVFDEICRGSYDAVNMIARCRYISLNSGEKYFWRYTKWCLKPNFSELSTICDMDPFPRVEALLRMNQTLLEVVFVEKYGVLANIPVIKVLSRLFDIKNNLKHCNVTLPIEDTQHEKIQEFCKKYTDAARANMITDAATTPFITDAITIVNPEPIADEASSAWIYILIGVLILVVMLVMLVFFFMKPSKRRSLVSNPLNQMNRNDTDNASTPFSKIADQTLRSDVDTFANKNPQSSIKLAKKELSSAKRSINKNMATKDSPRSRSSANTKKLYDAA